MQPPDEKTSASARDVGEVETAVPAPLQYSAALEKEATRDGDVSPPQSESKEETPGVNASDTAATAGDAAAAAPAEPEYPSTYKLILLTIGLCFALFLVSLVSADDKCMYVCASANIASLRTAPSSRPRSPKSPTSSTRSATSPGTGARTSSPSAPCSCCTGSCTPSTRSNGSSWPASSSSRSAP